MTSSDSKRYRIDNFDSFLRVLQSDNNFTLEFKDKTEQRITASLRRKYVKIDPDTVLDAFNNALSKCIKAKSFRDEGFLEGQPTSGWTASELATSKLGGYLYIASRNEVVLSYHKSKYHLAPPKESDEDAPVSTAGDVDELADEDPFNDPAVAYERAEHLRVMRDCMAKLSDTLRSVFFMEMDDIEQSEIAKQAGIPIGTVKSRVHSAYKFVEECTKRGLRL